jgi:putative ABC transport system substrate-binding protein
MTDRRHFALALGIAPLLAAYRAHGQSAPATVHRIAFIEAGSAAANQHFADSFARGMRELGYVEGRNVTVITRWAEGQAEGFRRALTELIPTHPDVVVVASTLGAIEAKRATASIPVVFIGVPDPVVSGLAASLAHPGGNMTGLARSAGEGLLSKTIQVLIELAPSVSRLAIIWNPGASINDRAAQVADAARKFSLVPIEVQLRSRDGFTAAFERIRNERANGLFVVTDPLTLANRDAIVALASAQRVPAVYEFGEFARSGGLVAYAPSVTEEFRRAAIYVDRILRGARPGDIPIEQPTKFELVLNLKAAKTLGLAIPQSLLLRADEVIE